MGQPMPDATTQIEVTRAIVEQCAEPMSECPICQSEEYDPCYRSVYKTLSMRYDRCLQCGFIFQNPMLGRAALEHIYSSQWYWGTGNDTEGVGYLNYLHDMEKFMKDHHRRFRRLASKGLPLRGRLLDVGCGAGYSAGVAQELGFSVVGIEPSPDMVEFGRGQFWGVEFHQGFWEDFIFVPGQADVVATWGTANNFRDPVAIFRRMHAALKPGGWVVTDFFDRNSLFSFLVESQFRRAINATGRHTKRSMRILFHRAGFRTLHLIPYLPYFSISHVLQMSPMPIRNLGRRWQGLRRAGLYVPVTGYYLIAAIK